MLSCPKNVASKKYLPPLIPYGPVKHFLAYFWGYYFDFKKKNLKGSIHTTHGVAVGSVNSVIPSGKTAVEFKTCNYEWQKLI